MQFFIKKFVLRSQIGTSNFDILSIKQNKYASLKISVVISVANLILSAKEICN